MRWLDSAPFWLVAPCALVLVLASIEAGFRVSRRIPVEVDQASTVATSILGMVGLVLAFCFSIAVDRQALRRAAAVDEASSIETFWLRTSLVAEPTRSAMQSRLRRYVDAHLEHRASGNDSVRTAALESEVATIHTELWALFAEDARRDPEAQRVRLLAPSLNEMIDDGAVVLAAKDNRLPPVLFAYVVLLAVVAGGLVGYRPRQEQRNYALWAAFSLVMAGILCVLVDLDSPRRGAIQTTSAVHERLRSSMREPMPGEVSALERPRECDAQ